MSLDVTVLGVAINESVNDISCFSFNDGEINISVSGGNPPYTYQWSNLSEDEDITNLSPGLYEIIVTDDEDCFETATYTIQEPALLVASIETFDVDCFGDNTGSVIVDVNGGTPPYIQTWSGGANPNNLFSGVYDLTVTDANSCAFVISEIVINQPELELELSANIVDVLPCNGDQTGSISPIASGGTPPYEYFAPGVNNLNLLFRPSTSIQIQGSSIIFNFFL